jgi:hypothetical protein
VIAEREEEIDRQHRQTEKRERKEREKREKRERKERERREREERERERKREKEREKREREEREKREKERERERKREKRERERQRENILVHTVPRPMVPTSPATSTSCPTSMRNTVPLRLLVATNGSVVSSCKTHKANMSKLTEREREIER